MAHAVVRLPARRTRARPGRGTGGQAARRAAQLRELLAHADPVRDGDRPALLDLARLGEALRVLADGLRDSTDDDHRARQAMAELEAAAGPLISALEAHDDEAQLARHRQNASDAIDAYFGEHSIAPGRSRLLQAPRGSARDGAHGPGRPRERTDGYASPDEQVRAGADRRSRGPHAAGRPGQHAAPRPTPAGEGRG